MRIIILATAALSIISITQAEYILKIPMEKGQGGQLPNGSIRFTSNWSNAPTVYGEWIDQGQPYDCNNWFPADSTVPMDETFTQTATDCSQDQTRTAQDQEVETISGIVRDKGSPYNQQRTITASSTRDSVGTLMSSWEQFAQEKGLSKTWNDLRWSAQGLSYLPNAPYPITSVGNFYLDNNQLTNVNGLSNLTSAKTLYLNNNQLTNVNGLSNLTSAKTLYLNKNQLTNVNGLSNLTSANNLFLDNNQLTNVDGLSNLTSANNLLLYQNQLTNVNGLANVKVSNNIIVDATYSGPKLAANTRFCTDNPDSVFPSGYAKKSQLCESP